LPLMVFANWRGFSGGMKGIPYNIWFIIVNNLKQTRLKCTQFRNIILSLLSTCMSVWPTVKCIMGYLFVSTFVAIIVLTSAYQLWYWILLLVKWDITLCDQVYQWHTVCDSGIIVLEIEEWVHF
jgi:hypothetical protein